MTNPHYVACIGSNRSLIIGQFIIGGLSTSAILDTGATASFISGSCTTAKSLKQSAEPVNIIVSTADEKSITANESIRTKIHPVCLPNLSQDILLYALRDRLNIMGYEIILGLDILHAFNIKIESSSNGMFASVDGHLIAAETKTLANDTLMSMQLELPQANPFDILIKEFDDVFAESAKTLIKTEPMKIPLLSPHAVKSKLRPHKTADILEIDRQVQSMIDNDIIEPSESPYAANVHLVPKKNGSRRMVVDFRDLNAVTERDGYPIPQISDQFLALHGATCFAALDCTEGFLQIPILPEHRHRTAFITAHGAYHFKRCPFGFTNSPAVFQRTMNRIFDRGLYRTCVVYIDDILVFARTEQELLENLRWIFERCRDNVVKLKRSKCKINVKECEYLGFKISSNHIAPVIGKYDPLGINIPRNRKNIKGILGALNHYARFIDKYTDKTTPIRSITRKDVVFEWSDDLTKLVEELKQELNSAIPQYIPHSDTPKTVKVYISQIAIEVTCYEFTDKLIGRAGYALSDSEANYTTIEQNLLAIILAYSKFGPILGNQVTFHTTCTALRHAIDTKHRTERVERLMLQLPPNCQFKVEVFPGKSEVNDTVASDTEHEELFYTDGACLRNGKSNSQASWAVLATMNPKLSASGLVEHKKPSNQIAEIYAILKACEIALDNNFKHIIIVTDSKYAQGSINKWIDCWKRNEWKDCRGRKVVNEDLMKQLAAHLDKLNINCLFVKGHSGDVNNEKVDLMAKQALEPDLKLGILALNQALVQQDGDEEIERIKANLELNPELQDKFIVENNELKYLDPHLPLECRKRIYTPQRDRRNLLRFAHDHEFYGGHLGVKKTRDKLKAYYWPGMTKDVERYVETCEVCQKHKTSKKPKYGLMQPIKVSEIFERVHVDIIGPMRQTDQASRYILTAIDAFSRYAYARATVDARARDIINFLKEEIFVKHGPPCKLVSDNGPQFLSNEFQSLIKSLGIKHSKTCEYHPQANGLDERLNGTLVKILKNYVSGDQANWDKHLNAALFVYNTARHESIDTSPYVAVYGVHPRSPLKYLQHDILEGECLSSQDRHKLIRDFIKKAQEAAQLDQKKYYDAKRRDHNFQVLDIVKAKTHYYTPGLSRKLLPKWESPCIITQIIESDGKPVAAKLRNLDTGKARRSAFVDIMPLQTRDLIAGDSVSAPSDSIPFTHGDILASELSRRPHHFDDSYDEIVDIIRAPMPVPIRTAHASRAPRISNTISSSYDEIAIPNFHGVNQNRHALSHVVPLENQSANLLLGSQPQVDDAALDECSLRSATARVSSDQTNLRRATARVDSVPSSSNDDLRRAAPVQVNLVTGSCGRTNDDNCDMTEKNAHSTVQKHHSTPIANTSSIPTNLETGATSMIASGRTNQQVSLAGASDATGTQNPSQEPSSRPRRLHKQTDRYQA